MINISVMEKLLILLFVLITENGSSQIIRKKIPAVSTDSHFKIQIKKNNQLRRGYLNNISTRIIRDFNKRFINATNTRWFVNAGIITGYFECDSIQITTVYLENGSFVLTRKDYQGNKLDTTILKFLKIELGICYSVNLVTELIRTDYTIYSISLKGPEYWCIIELLKNKEEAEVKVNNKEFFKRD